MQPNIDNTAEQFVGTSDDARWILEDNDDYEPSSVCPSDSGVALSETPMSANQGPSTSPSDSASTASSQTPWISDRRYPHSIEGLHAEVLECSNWLKSTPQEIYARVNVCQRVRRILNNFWRDSTLRVFGSVATDLFLPTSDIDLSVDLTRVNPETMRCAAAYFEDSDDFAQVQVLDKAYVPIIKLQDRSTGIHIDVSFNTQRAQEAVDYICRLRNLYPAVGPIALLLKQFLALQELNHAFTGGLSSYGLVLMIAHFMLRCYRDEFLATSVHTLRDGLLGQFLLDFFKFYGEDFDPVVDGLAFENAFTAHVVPKVDLVDQMREPLCASIFCLQDPLQKSNDVGRGAHRFMQVRSCFKLAYDQLKAAMEDNECTEPMLSAIMKFPPEIVSIRLKMQESAIETWFRHHPGTPTVNDGMPPGPHPMFFMPEEGGFYFPTMKFIFNNLQYRGFPEDPEECILDAMMYQRFLLQQVSDAQQCGIEFDVLQDLTQRFALFHSMPSMHAPPPPLPPPPLPFAPHFLPNGFIPVIPPPQHAFPVIQHPYHVPMPMHPSTMFPPNGPIMPEMVQFVPPGMHPFVLNYPGFPPRPISTFAYGPPGPYMSPPPSNGYITSLSPPPRIGHESESSSTGSTNTPNDIDCVAGDSDDSCKSCQTAQSRVSGSSDLSSISPNSDNSSIREASSSSPLFSGLSD